jgi:hypothetical protein
MRNQNFLNLVAVLTLTFTSGCIRNEVMYAKMTEAKLLQSVNPFDPNLSVQGVDDEDDAKVPNTLASSGAAEPTWVVRCTPERYALERAEAIRTAKADPDNSTIPVKFSLSTGTLFDDSAYAAHRRSIIRKDSNNESRFYVGPANQFVHNGTNAFHYVVDHSQARSNFLSGEKCFFDTVRVKRGVKDEIRMENGQANHGYRTLYYGNTYPNPKSPDIIDGGVSPRLFKKLADCDHSKVDPQIVPLFVADIRASTLAELGIPDSILNPNFTSSAVRRQEYQLGYKSIFDLTALWKHRTAVTRILSSNRLLGPDGMPILAGRPGARAYSAYEGVPQLMDWIVFSGLSATVMSTQYTPIVLDLGEEKIRTSSLDWGTFFNLAGLKRKVQAQQMASIEAPGVSHLTAWLGGYVQPVANPSPEFPQSLERVAQDGFLVVPNADGSVTGPQNLFGEGFGVLKNGMKQTFQNGFLALAAFAKKDCSSNDIKSRYVGPWDGEIYENALKVWIDENRNGVAERPEVKGLREARVGAMSACYVVHKQDKDKFGNRTDFRAAFLMLEEEEKSLDLSAEIIKRITTGRQEDGKLASFRVMIDVFFRTLPQVYLEDAALEDVTFADGSPVPSLKQ